MLELAKILKDIDDLGRERAQALAGLGDELARAKEIVSAIKDDLSAARSRINRAQTSWLLADFEEPPDKTYELPPLPGAQAVLAVDGSQIVPDKHEATLCYLLNAAGVILYYGTGERPVARTMPKLFYRDEDLFEEPYGRRRVPVADKLLSMRRTLAESAELESLLQAVAASGVPAVALWDGSLIRWALESEPTDYKERVLAQYLRPFDLAKELRIPIAGYISDPGSRDFVNSLRVMLCDQTPVDCDKCAHKSNGTEPPCDAVGRLTDAIVHGRRLKEGGRSVLFSSKSRILESYGEHRVLAFYMDAGREIVRVEVPEWVANDAELLDRTHAVCHDQAQKGRGYPVALSEAHEHAVIRVPERAAFYEMVERSFIKHGARITRSLKRLSKGY
jgi:hypothetical protein